MTIMRTKLTLQKNMNYAMYVINICLKYKCKLIAAQNIMELNNM